MKCIKVAQNSERASLKYHSGTRVYGVVTQKSGSTLLDSFSCPRFLQSSSEAVSLVEMWNPHPHAYTH